MLEGRSAVDGLITARQPCRYQVSLSVCNAFEQGNPTTIVVVDTYRKVHLLRTRILCKLLVQARIGSLGAIGRDVRNIWNSLYLVERVILRVAWNRSKTSFSPVLMRLAQVVSKKLRERNLSTLL